MSGGTHSRVPPECVIYGACELGLRRSRTKRYFSINSSSFLVQKSPPRLLDALAASGLLLIYVSMLLKLFFPKHAYA